MNTLRYSHKIKKDNIIGNLDVYDDMLKIVTNQTNREIEFSFIKSLFLSEINNKDFEIELKNNEVIHIVLINPEKENFIETYNYINKLTGLADNNKLDNSKTQQNIQEQDNDNENNIIQENVERDNPSLPLTINATSTLNKNLLFALQNETYLKQDLSYINDINFTSEGEFGVYDSFLNIDNPQYELNLPYSMLRNIELKTTMETVLIITLNTGSSIYINPIGNDKEKIQQIYQIIQVYINNPPITNNNIQQVPSYNNQLIQQQPPQQYYQPNYQQPMYNQPPLNKKSVLVAIILHLLLIGLGYGYLNKWGKFLAVLFLALICFFTSFLIIPALIAIILWIYVLIDTIRMVEKYNNGEQY